MSHFSIRGNCLGVPGRLRKRNSDSKQHSPLPLLSVLWTPRGCPWTGLLQAHFEAESVKCISGTLTLNHRTYRVLWTPGEGWETVSRPHQSWNMLRFPPLRLGQQQSILHWLQVTHSAFICCSSGQCSFLSTHLLAGPFAGFFLHHPDSKNKSEANCQL